MKTNVYTIFDVKAGAYLQPFFSLNSATAQRSIAQLVNDPTHTFGINVTDYSLFRIAEYDDSNAQFDLELGPVLVCNLVELVDVEIPSIDPDQMPLGS